MGNFLLSNLKFLLGIAIAAGVSIALFFGCTAAWNVAGDIFNWSGYNQSSIEFEPEPRVENNILSVSGKTTGAARIASLQDGVYPFSLCAPNVEGSKRSRRLTCLHVGGILPPSGWNPNPGDIRALKYEINQDGSFAIEAKLYQWPCEGNCTVTVWGYETPNGELTVIGQTSVDNEG